MPNVHALRPTALTLCLIAAIAAPLAADAAKKRKTAAPAPKAPPAATACSDFYAFSNAEWLKSHAAPGSGVTTAMGELVVRAAQQQRELLDASMTSPQSPGQKILGDFWASGLDEAAIERDGAAAIAPLLARVAAIKKAQDIAPIIAALHQTGIPVAYGFHAAPDPRNPGTDAGYFVPGGMALPAPEFYTRSDANARALLGHYNGYVQKILALTGTAQGQLNAEAQQVIDLETRIARVAKSPADAFSPTAVKDLAKRYRNLQVEAFLKAQGVSAQQVSLADTAYFAQVDKLIASLKPAQWKTYLRFQIGHAMAPSLGKAWRSAEHDFQGRMLRGDDEPAPYWRQTLDAIDTNAGAVLAQEYTAKYLPAANRERTQAIAQQVRDALAAAIERNTWMDAQAKTEARAKLDKVRIGIGSPQQTMDIGGLGITRNSFGANVLAAKSWAHREAMKRIGGGNAETAWAIAAYTPALRYDLADNRLLITAAVLQPPVFDMSQGLAAQYGSLGALIGHELGRAVDGKGRRIDATGAARDWWTPATAAAWDARIAPLTARYGAIAYPGQTTLKVDGARTREENAADLSGLELAWAAFEKADAQAKAADQQNFFRGWARLWAQSFSANAAATHAATATHAPGIARTNGVVMQLPAFAKAYACKAGNAMLLSDTEQVSIWR